MGRGTQDWFPKGENDTSSTVGMACNLQNICWWSIYQHAAANGLKGIYFQKEINGTGTDQYWITDENSSFGELSNMA